MITLYKNIAYKLELVVLDNDGKFTPGLTVTYEIRKCSDDSLFASGTMSETSSVYYVDVTFTVNAEYKVKYVTPVGYENGFEEILVENNLANQVWDALTAEHTLSNTFGYMFIHINSTVAAINSLLESVSSTLNTVEYYCENMADIIWSNSTRTLTSFGTLVASIWSYGTRTLTSYGTLVSDISTAVWGATTRTLTSFGTLIADIWNYVTRTITSGGITAAEVWTYITRTLTAGTKDSEIDAIKTQTDKIPRILGLSMENHRIFSPVYDSNNCLTSATIKIYPTKADVLADTNSIAIYAMVATFDVDGKCLTYRMTKE